MLLWFFPREPAAELGVRPLSEVIAQHMPRHTFPIPEDVRVAVRAHIAAVVARVDPRRFNQEATYVAALANAIEGVAYNGPNGKVSFTATAFDDRGPNSAESRIGADIAITAEIERGTTRVRKAILVQAKLGRVADLPADERNRLRGQVERMRGQTDHRRSWRFQKRTGFAILGYSAEGGYSMTRFVGQFPCRVT